MTFLQLAKLVRQETGLSGDGPATVATQVGDYKRVIEWVNSAYQDILNKWLDWNFLWDTDDVTLADTTQDYDLPATCATIDFENVYLGEDQLTYLPFPEYRRDRLAWLNATGTPSTYTILPNGKMRVLPTPEAADAGDLVVFDFWKFGVPLSGNTDQPLFPAAFHDTIVHRAKWYWAVYDNADTEAKGADLLYTQALARLEAHQKPSNRKEQGRAEGADIVVRAS